MWVENIHHVVVLPQYPIEESVTLFIFPDNY